MAKINSSGNKPQIDVEKLRFCDTFDVAGVETKKEFIRCFVYKNGVLDANSTKDYELDGITPYVVQGTVTRCIEDIPDQCDLVDVWLCSGGTNGVNESIWEASAVTANASSSQAIELGFTQLDECGLLLHENPADTIQIINKAATTNITTAGVPNQNVLDFYVKTNIGTNLKFRSGGIHSGAAAIGTCIGKLKESLRYDDGSIDIIGNIGRGIFKVRTWVHDPSFSGTHGVQIDLNGDGSYVDIPEDQLYVLPPVVEHTKAYYNKTDCKYYRADDKTEIDQTSVDVLCYDPCQGDFQVVIDQPLEIKGEVSVTKELYSNLGKETVEFDDTSAGKLTVPAGATYATIQFQGDCASMFNLDGTNPKDLESKVVFPCDVLELGCSRHFTGDVADLANFVALAKEAGCTNFIQVCYYGEA